MIYRNYIKRLLDFILSLLALTAVSPILLIVAILIRAKLGNPVIFKQERPGLNERIFTLYKFRTMNDAKDANEQLLPDHVRLSRFGKLLRSTSIDELPELWNILRGDMSFVGPRPLLVQYLPLYTSSQRQRHDVRPGLTGLAQVNGRNSISWEDRFKLDVQYVKELTFYLDLSIFIKTIRKVFIAEGISSTNSVTMEPFTGSIPTDSTCEIQKTKNQV